MFIGNKIAWQLFIPRGLLHIWKVQRIVNIFSPAAQFREEYICGFLLNKIHRSSCSYWHHFLFLPIPFEEASTYVLYKQIMDFKNKKPVRIDEIWWDENRKEHFRASLV